MDDLKQIEFDGQKLREARGDRALSEAAQAVGVTKQMLWNYENGHGDPSSAVVARLCLLYQKPIEFFIKAKSGEKNFSRYVHWLLTSSTESMYIPFCQRMTHSQNPRTPNDHDQLPNLRKSS
jgi:transcriptional regulator with XRE-family HTH domain